MMVTGHEWSGSNGRAVYCKWVAPQVIDYGGIVVYLWWDVEAPCK